MQNVVSVVKNQSLFLRISVLTPRKPEDLLTLIKDDESLDRLNKNRWILHRKKGHKATTDDQLLAWATSVQINDEQTHSIVWDLGSGKGTVSLFLTSLHQHLKCIGIEAFEQSYQQALRNLELNQIEKQYFPHLGDLRDLQLCTQLLNTYGSPSALCGAPPFMPLGSGVLPQDAQRAHGRFEMNGGVEAYLKTYAWIIQQHSQCIGILLMDGQSEQRTRLALHQYPDLRINQCTSILPRPNCPPTYQIFTLTHRESDFLSPLPSHLSMRNSTQNEWSPDYQEIRSLLLL